MKQAYELCIRKNIINQMIDLYKNEIHDLIKTEYAGELEKNYREWRIAKNRAAIKCLMNKLKLIKDKTL